MCKYLFAGAALLLLSGPVAVVKADPASINPSVTVSPAQGGTVVTPSVTVNVPAGNGGSIQGLIQVPIVVPNRGSPIVVPPTITIGGSIPLR